MSENIQQIYVANPTTAMVSNDLLYLGRSPYGVSDDFAILWSNMQLSITAVGIIAAGTWNGTTIAVAHGGTGVTSVTTAPTATSFAGWDANSNLSASNFIPGFATTATAAATTTLTVASKSIQEFTGSTTQTVVMPVTSTLVAGFPFKIINNSSGAVTVNSSGGNPIQVMAANTTLYLTCVLNSGTTAASWNGTYITDGAGVLSITGTTNQVIASSSTGNVTLSLPQSIGTGSTPTFAGMTLSDTLNITPSGNVVLDDGAFYSGKATGSTAGSFVAYAPTSGLGYLWLQGADNAGNFGNKLTNASTAAARTWTLPDATGTIALTSGASGIVNSGTQNQLAWYAGTGTTVSGLATANNGILVTSAGGVPSIGNSVGADITINGVIAGRSGGNSATNTVFGATALDSNSGGTENCAFGNAALTACNSNDNCAFGYQSLMTQINGTNSSAFGAYSLNSTTGTGNTAFGYASLFSLSTGTTNTAIGRDTGRAGATGAVAVTTGTDNTFVGAFSSANNSAASGVLALGNSAVADIATGATSSDNGPGIAIGSAAFPVGFRGDGTIYPSTTGSGFWRQKINGTYYQTLLFADGSTGLPALTAPSINFGGTSLANYVEGTFTPTFTTQSPGDLSVVYSAQVGTYTRIGNRVFLEAHIAFTPTFTTATGTLRFAGLPFTCASTTSGSISSISSGFIWAGYTMIAPEIDAGNNFFYLILNVTAANTNVMATTNIVSGGALDLYITMSYKI